MMETLKRQPTHAPPANLPTAEQRLESLVREQGPSVRAVLHARYRGAFGGDDIDDVLATTVHRLWKHRDKLVGLKSPRAWFLRIADNIARDVLRFGWQKARQLEVSTDRTWLEAIPAPTPEPAGADAARDDALSSALREIIATLPALQRRILWADALNPDGPVASETLAAELKITPGAVRVYRKRGLDRLRSEMEKRNLLPDHLR
jgi:RNA polymerase sigma factor (sigma-70 family)